MINERDGSMEDKKGISPVLIGFIILVLGAVVFLVVKGIGFGIDFYNKYWIENNRSYAKDVEFFDVKHFDHGNIRLKMNWRIAPLRSYMLTSTVKPLKSAEQR